MRINCIAAPGAGKSTLTADLFSKLKRRGYSIEQVFEFVKSWSYIKRQINPFDQVYLFGKQSHYEYRCLANGVRNIITDSPLLLCCFYSSYLFPTYEVGQALMEVNRLFTKEHPEINIFLKLSDDYQTEGRYQNQEQARDVEKCLEAWLQINNIPYHAFNRGQEEEILSLVEPLLL